MVLGLATHPSMAGPQCLSLSDSHIGANIVLYVDIQHTEPGFPPDVAVAAVRRPQQGEGLQEGGVVVLGEAEHVDDNLATVAGDGLLKLLAGVQQLKSGRGAWGGGAWGVGRGAWGGKKVQE